MNRHFNRRESAVGQQRTRPKIERGDFSVRDPAAVRLTPRFVNVKFCTAEVGEPRHTQGRFGCRVNRPLQPYLSFLNRWTDSLVLCFLAPPRSKARAPC